MSKPKDGDRVLVEAVYEGETTVNTACLMTCGGRVRDPLNTMNRAASHCHAYFENVHVDPGVPVADLVRECELAWDVICEATSVKPPGFSMDQWDEIKALRDAREAAGKPKFQEGKEVWVRAAYSGFKSADPRKVVVTYGDNLLRVYPEDIRTEAPVEAGGEGDPS